MHRMRPTPCRPWPWQGESVNRHRSGRLYAVDETITPVVAEDGTTTCVVVVQRDMSARQQAEQDRDLYAQLLAATGAAVIGTDLDGRVTFWNRAAERLYGWRSEEVKGRDILEVNVHPEAAAHAGWIMSQLRAGKSWTGEFEVQRRDGVRVPALVTNAPYKVLELTRDGAHLLVSAGSGWHDGVVGRTLVTNEQRSHVSASSSSCGPWSTGSRAAMRSGWPSCVPPHMSCATSCSGASRPTRGGSPA